MEELRRALERMEERLSELTRRADGSRQLAARAYERSFDFPGQLAALRGSDTYAEPYEPNPLVSVVLPTFNRAQLLRERGLASVLRQSYERLEVIVVGNACTDDTADAVDAVGDSRVRFVNLPYQEPEPEDEMRRWVNSGSVPINHGLAIASGSWIAIQHDDDEWDARYLETVLRAAQEGRAEIAYCRARVVHGPTGKPMSFEVGAFPPVMGHFGSQYSIFHSGLRFFGYDRACAWLDEPNDWNFARRMWEAGVRFYFVPSTLATYHLTPRTEAGREWVAERFGDG
jgi:glycosyltransferase involved in cell wall biosynthesis